MTKFRICDSFSIFCFSLLMALVFTTAACSTQRGSGFESETLLEDPNAGFLQHRIQFKGETLGYIAKWYTGRVENWKALAAENPQIVPEKIQLGQIVRVPRTLIVNDSPLPKDFLARLRTRRSGAKAAVSSTSGEGTDLVKSSASSGNEPIGAASEAVLPNEQELPNGQEAGNPVAAGQAEVEKAAAQASSSDDVLSTEDLLELEASLTKELEGDSVDSSGAAVAADAQKNSQEVQKSAGSEQADKQAAAGDNQGAGVDGEDAERELLLNELLSQ